MEENAGGAAGLSRKERERERHRRAVLEAAEKVFSTRGYHAATIQEIAGLAEFSVGALYNMFAGKEDLYRRLVELRVEEFLGEVEERLEQAGDARGKVRAVLETKLEFFNRRKDFFRIFAHVASGEGGSGPPPPSRACLEMLQSYEERLVDAVAAGVREGVFADRDPWLVVLCLEGMTNAIVGRWIHTGDDQLDRVDPDRLEEIVMHGIMAEGAGE